jgi:hypothetical protein
MFSTWNYLTLENSIVLFDKYEMDDEKNQEYTQIIIKIWKNKLILIKNRRIGKEKLRMSEKKGKKKSMRWVEKKNLIILQYYNFFIFYLSKMNMSVWKY